LSELGEVVILAFLEELGQTVRDGSGSRAWAAAILGEIGDERDDFGKVLASLVANVGWCHPPGYTDPPHVGKVIRPDCQPWKPCAKKRLPRQSDGVASCWGGSSTAAPSVWRANKKRI
jgi:hypothetical protein